MFPFSPMPSSLRRQCRRYRLRLQILSALVLTCLSIEGINILFEYLLWLPRFQEGALKITARHFRQPEQSLFHPKNWYLFLDGVTAGKPGLLGEKWFYLVWIALLVLLSVWVFLRLTPPEPDTVPPGSEKDRLTDEAPINH